MDPEDILASIEGRKEAEIRFFLHCLSLSDKEIFHSFLERKIKEADQDCLIKFSNLMRLLVAVGLRNIPFPLVMPQEILQLKERA
jgi:hypothetical protein